MTTLAPPPSWPTGRTRIAGLAIPVLLLAEQIALGANGPLLAIAAAVAQLATAMLVLALLEPDRQFWAAGWPVLGLMGCIAAWTALPHVLPQALRPDTVAPDLWASGATRLFGEGALLLAAGVVGYRRGLMRYVLDRLILFGGVQLLAGAVMCRIEPGRVWGFDKGILAGRYTGTFLNANASACLFGAVTILAFGRWLTGLREASLLHDTREAALFRLLCIATVLAGYVSCATTGSRTALALTSLALAALALGDGHVLQALRGRTGAVLGIASVAIVAALVAIAGHATLDRLGTLGTDTVGRAAILDHYAELAMEAPVFGHGLGGFDAAALRGLHGPAQAIEFWYIHSPHNAALALLIEGGWPYLILVVLLVAAMATDIVRQRRSDRQDPQLRSIGAALLVMLGCSGVDIVFDVPALSALAAVLIGMAWGRALRIGADRRRDPDAQSARRSTSNAAQRAPSA